MMMMIIIIIIIPTEVDPCQNTSSQQQIIRSNKFPASIPFQEGRIFIKFDI
jgi:hypothetical protein